MILPFTTQINGKPTYFVEKIHSCLLQNNLLQGFDLGDTHHFDIDKLSECQPKIHTFREDKNSKWKPGMMIDFFINNRQKDMFRFAPRIPCKGTQTVFMTYAYNDIIEISISGRPLHSFQEKLKFAINDGFDNWMDFFNWFYPLIEKSEDQELSGKIIHWTNFRYE